MGGSLLKKSVGQKIQTSDEFSSELGPDYKQILTQTKNRRKVTFNIS